MFRVTVNGTKHLSILPDGQQFIADKHPHLPEITRIDDASFLVVLDNKPYYVGVIDSGTDRRNFRLSVNNKAVSVSIRHQSETSPETSDPIDSKRFTEYLKAPMPGLVADVLVSDGEKVIDGQPLLILKAMKMENILRAPHDATIRQVKVVNGQRIGKDELLIQF